MALPKNIQKTLILKPEVTKIFDDLETWLDHCRFSLLPYNEADLYRSHEYKDFIRWNRPQGERKYYNNNRKFNRA